MALVNYNPRLDLTNSTFNSLLDSFFNRTIDSSTYKNESFYPKVDIVETNQSYEISFAVPGISKEDFNIDLNDGRLTVSGERKFEEVKDEKNYHSIETQYGSFKRSFHIPDHVNVDKIDASYKDGILKIFLPKEEKKVEKTTIEIK